MFGEDMNSGYKGYSMSVRAAEAYENGEKPISRWTKKAILEELNHFCNDNEVALPFSIETLKKAPLPLLKDLVLSNSSWHHTSQYANSTKFYSLDKMKVFKLTDEIILNRIKEWEESSSSLPQNKEKVTYAEVLYEEWEGSRRNPDLVPHYDVGIITNWVFKSGTDGQTKRTDGKHFYCLKELSSEEYKKRIRNEGKKKVFESKTYGPLTFKKAVANDWVCWLEHAVVDSWVCEFFRNRDGYHTVVITKNGKNWQVRDLVSNNGSYRKETKRIKAIKKAEGKTIKDAMSKF